MDAECTKNHLLDIAMLDFDWRRVGRRLLDSDQNIIDIGRDQPDEPNRRETMLMMWRNQKGSAATYRVLADTFKLLQCGRVAEMVEKMVGERSNGGTPPVQPPSLAPCTQLPESQNPRIGCQVKGTGRQEAGSIGKKTPMKSALATQDRFRGTLLGALVGDCMGAYWKRTLWLGTHPIEDIKAKIRGQVERALSKKTPLLRYTDDTALTFAMAESLVECEKYDAAAMAKKLTEIFFAEPYRGYGPSVRTVFSRLQEGNYRDVYGPASEQFEGQGSYGNDSCMRTSPGALLGYKDEEVFFEVCEGTAKITHSHHSAINGTLLQALAVKLALDSRAPLDPVDFVDTLLEKMAPFESDRASSDEDLIGGLSSYKSQLSRIRSFLCAYSIPSADVVRRILGHGIKAVEAAPCALYAFLHCYDKSFEELVPYAISLGGDTDTIASMAGAIGGAFWGEAGIPREWIKSCEGSEHAQSLGGQLFDIVCCKSYENAQSSGDLTQSSEKAQSSGDLM